MERWEQVAIVGVGLIGGSIGLALAERGLASRIVGVGRRRSTLDRAVALGAITHATTEFGDSLAGSQLAVICTPVSQVAQHARQTIAACPMALVTDVASTKASIVTQLEADSAIGGRFVGSHPLAGSEKTGVEHAAAELFVGRTVVVTPTESTNPDDVLRIEQFWESLGSRVLRMSPREHDRAVAMSSHLPHLVAAALATATPAESRSLVAGGWLDTTRIAAGDPELWCQILIDNRGAVLRALDKFDTVLTQFRHALETQNGSDLMALLETGKNRRDTMGS